MQEPGKTEIFKLSPLFSGLEADELAGLAALASERRFAENEFIFLEGDPAESFYIVAQGKIKVLKHSSSGRDFIVAFFGPGEMFGEVALFENKPYPASAQSAAASRVLSIRRQDFIKWLSQRPQVSLKIINLLGGRLREAQNRLRDLAGETVERRLAAVLLQLSAKMGKELPFTRQELADMAGTTTETAIRIIGQMKERGIVDAARGHIIILDEKKLQLLSQGPPKV